LLNNLTSKNKSHESPSHHPHVLKGTSRYS
jgi:hypothetical protein